MKRFKLYATLWLVCLFCTGAIANAQTRIDVSPAGSLNAKLGNDKNTIENLVLSGSLNGDDIKTIRQMTKLRILNLEDASIVSGGSQYYPESGCNTEDNVIGRKMFFNMNRLVSLRLPKNTIKIDYSAMQNCINLSDVNIPEGINRLNSDVFNGCEKLMSIIIPSTIEYIGYNCFTECSSLETAIFPEIVKDNFSMGNGIFSGCISLKNVTLPTNLKEMPYQIFRGCISLEKITLPETVTKISDSAFDGCISLKTIQLPNNLNNISIAAFSNTGLINISIPDNVETIGSSAFSGCSHLTSIKFPSNDSYQIIESNIFNGCSSLKSLDLPNSITLIGQSAFLNCKKLETISMPINLQGSIPTYCFFNCSSLKEVIIPDGISKIERNAFDGCTSLTNARFPNDLYSIEAEAFQNCKKLTNLVLPERINSIGVSAFNNCESLGTITFPSTLRNIYGFSNTGITKVILPEGIKKIEAHAFSGCHKLESIEFPSTLDSIKNNAFYECDALTSVTLPNNLTGLGEQAFANCRQLRNITIPASLDTIHKRTFNNCDSLRTVIIPDGIKRIKSLAFESCDSLEVVTLPTTLLNIGAKVFANTNLKTISIPEGITYLAGGVFQNCRKLRKVTLPSTLKELRYTYEEEGQQGYDGYGGVFDECIQLSEITLPNNLINIGDYTFLNCSKLQNIILPTKLTTIGVRAFYGSNLNSIELPTSLTSIKEDALYTSNKFKTVIWNSNIPISSNIFGAQLIEYLFVSNNISIDENVHVTYIIRDGIIDMFTPRIEQQYINDHYINTYNMPKAFHALKATYTRNFSQTSGNGTAAGWETIVLPYNVNKFTYKKRYSSDDEVEIAPFGSPALDAGARPFWLYEMTADGYRSATTIEAHKPYLICMPNNDMYPSSNNINGDVTFIGEDATNGVLISETEGKLSPVAGPSYNLVPTYQTVTQSDQIYKLNVGQSYGDNYEYLPGSVFVKNLGDIDPFQAYVTVNSPADKAPKFFSIGGNGGGITGMESLMLTPTESVKVYSNNGVIYIHSNAARTISIYDINGRTVYTLDANEGDNEVNGLPDGVYFLEGQKVMVRHK